MKTIVYVDGFNLYYRALKKSQYKWLDLYSLCVNVLPENTPIDSINYYTARVSGRVSPTSPRDQNTYLKALGTLPALQVHYGSFQVTDKWMYLTQPPEFRPNIIVPAGFNARFARTVKTEEKGSDVNLGVHLVRDAFLKRYEHAAIITNDTDLVEPIRIVVEEAKLPVTLISPVARPAANLKKLANYVRHIRSGHLAASQFPDEIISGDGAKIIKPVGW